jgi:gamma-D-glutamyl-L-lysine dipeptidyl-peptidase
MRFWPIMLVLTASFAAQEPPSPPDRAVVTRPVLNMYAEATSDSPVVSQALYGVTVLAPEWRGAWTRIQTPDEYSGWVETDGLRLLEPGTRYPEQGKPSAVIESLAAHLYAAPSVTSRAPMLTLPYEVRLEIEEELPDDNRRWLKVKLPDGWSAWIQRGDLRFEAPPGGFPALADFAKRFLGLPYTWGGTSAFGFDCSGFTQMLSRRAGVAIPRDAKPQAHWDGMDEVARDALRPGDLIYFGAEYDKISHTGFYLGDGTFIHATTHLKPVLQISRLDEEHWDKLYICARRWKK